MQTYSRLEKRFRSLAKENINAWGKENFIILSCFFHCLLQQALETSSGCAMGVSYCKKRKASRERSITGGGVVQIGYQTPKTDLLVICIYRVVLPKTWRFKEFSSSIGDHWHSTVKSPATAAAQLRYFIRKLAPGRTSRSCDTLAVIIFNRDLNGITEKE